MDETYSAIFSKWIRNEDNLPSAIHHMTRVANEYPLHQIIIAIQWLITDWRLKSIILLVINVTANWNDEEKLGALVKALANRWKPKFVGELTISVMERWNKNTWNNEEEKRVHSEKKERMLRVLMRGWQFRQISDVLLHLGSKLQWNVKCRIFKWYQENERTSRPTCNVPIYQLVRQPRPTTAAFNSDLTPCARLAASALTPPQTLVNGTFYHRPSSVNNVHQQSEDVEMQQDGDNERLISMDVFSDSRPSSPIQIMSEPGSPTAEIKNSLIQITIGRDAFSTDMVTD
jgi:hypothetical protein